VDRFVAHADPASLLVLPVLLAPLVLLVLARLAIICPS
jgi:hypothetical protein